MTEAEILRRVVTLQNTYLVSIGIDSASINQRNWSRTARALAERRDVMGAEVDRILKSTAPETRLALARGDASGLDLEAGDLVEAIRIQQSACNDAVAKLSKIHWESWHETFHEVTSAVEQARFSASDAMSRRPPPVIGFRSQGLR